MKRNDHDRGISIRAVWLLVLMFVILGGASAYLLTKLYRTTSLLAESNLRSLVQETDHKKDLLKELFRQRVNDFQTIAKSQAFNAFYHSKSIEVSPQYGLIGLISEIESELNNRLVEIQESGIPVFLRIAYYDFGESRVLAEAPLGHQSDSLDKSFFDDLEKTAVDVPDLFVPCRDSRCRLFIYGAVIYKGTPKGILVTELDPKAFLNRILSIEPETHEESHWILDGSGTVIVGPESVTGRNIQEIFGASHLDLLVISRRTPRDKFPALNKERMLVVGRSLKVGNLFVLKVAPEAIYGEAPSLWAWGVLVFSLMGALGLMVVYVFRSFRVQTRMNLALQAAKKQLESRVETRTSELAATNEELLREVKERQQVQKKLYQHAQILSSITDTILIISRDKKIVYANPTACEIFGDGTEVSLLNRYCYDALKKCNAVCDECLIEQALSDEKPHKNVTTWNDRNGKELWVYNTAFPYYDDDGQLVGAIVLSTDYSAQKEVEIALNRAKEHAEAASQAKSDFLARMSHEIRTPMYGILGTLELVLDGELKPEQRDLLLTARFSAEALQGILNDILDFSKIEARKIDLETKIFSPLAIVESIFDTLAVKADEKGLELVSDVRPDVPAALIGDPFRLRQVLLNLVGNAIKFTHDGEVVLEVIRKQSSGDNALLEFIVSDTGIGILPEKLKSIFDPFAQAEGFISRTFGGTGLGLAISSTLVEIMGGKILVESVPDQGTSFHFSLPFKVTEEAQPLEATYCADSNAVRVLVVDDNATNRRILTETVDRWGFSPDEAPDAEQALLKLARAEREDHPYQLMLLDYRLPGMSGLELLEQIGCDANLKVIFLTSSSGTRERNRATDLGASVVLLKPVKQSELRRNVWKALGWTAEMIPQRLSVGPPKKNGLTQAEQSLRVLLAEDNPVNQKLITRVLEKSGYQVSIVGNGKLAVNAAAEGDFDMVLMDIQMPVMDGLTATKIIRENEEGSGRHLPIFAMTAHAYQEAEQMCRESGMDGYLTKPISGAKLTQILAKILARTNPPPENMLL
ncbi:MAG: response regulator [Deltaproteobacteria bacterium]|nr:response regulator [Deltaproteobacteria bacterium]